MQNQVLLFKNLTLTNPKPTECIPQEHRKKQLVFLPLKNVTLTKLKRAGRALQQHCKNKHEHFPFKKITLQKQQMTRALATAIFGNTKCVFAIQKVYIEK